MVAELLYADGQTDRHDEAKSRFSHFFSNAPKTPFIKDEELYNQPQDYNLLHGINYKSLKFLTWTMI